MIKMSLAAVILAAQFGTGRAWAQPAATGDAATPAAAQAAAPDAAPAAEDQASAELREHHRHHHLGGIAQFISMSLDTLGADEAKRPKIERIQHELHVCMAPAGKAERGVLKTIADGVAAGAIDAAKVDAGIDRLGTAAGDIHSCSFKALNRLYKILSAAERQALVDKVQAHWEVWRQVNHEAEVGGREKGGHLSELAKELSLTPAQVENISASLRAGQKPAHAFEPKEAEEHLQAFATAFTSDSFDAKAILANANGRLATHGAKRMASFYEAVTPLLTPDQRTTLAAHLREHSGHQPTSN